MRGFGVLTVECHFFSRLPPTASGLEDSQVTEVTFVKCPNRANLQRLLLHSGVRLLWAGMTSRIAILISATALAITPALAARQAGASAEFGFASNTNTSSSASPSAKSRSIQGQRDVLEMVGDSLRLSIPQKTQLQTIIGHERELLASLHQHLEMSDEQKSAEFQRIRRQTKEQFVAILTSEQRREYESMVR